VEEGETPEECIQREMREEIDIDIGRPMLFHEYHMTDRIEFTFWQEAEFELSEIALHEGQRLKWFTENEILEMSDDDLAFGFRKVLLDFYRERPFDKATQKDRESESRDQLESRI
jgi:8-oxo-dGTP diphosphatase